MRATRRSGVAHSWTTNCDQRLWSVRSHDRTERSSRLIQRTEIPGGSDRLKYASDHSRSCTPQCGQNFGFHPRPRYRLQAGHRQFTNEKIRAVATAIASTGAQSTTGSPYTEPAPGSVYG